jgi:hypothetical protein
MGSSFAPGSYGSRGAHQHSKYWAKLADLAAWCVDHSACKHMLRGDLSRGARGAGAILSSGALCSLCLAGSYSSTTTQFLSPIMEGVGGVIQTREW